MNETKEITETQTRFITIKPKRKKAPAFHPPTVLAAQQSGNLTLEYGTDSETDAQAVIRFIFACAKELGFELDNSWLFGRGQVFFKGNSIDEVRLDCGVRDEAGELQEIVTAHKSDEYNAPTIWLYRDGHTISTEFIIGAGDANRAHVSACAVPKEVNGKAQKTAADALVVVFNWQGLEPESMGSTRKSDLPKNATQNTFIEARTVSHAISDAESEKDWVEVEGTDGLALLHSPRRDGKKAPLQTRFEPIPELWGWWGLDPKKEAVLTALRNLNFETNITFQVTLACLLQTKHARQTFTLDEIIKLIGRDTDARRSTNARQQLRREVWTNILALASMPVVGARNGVWREPGPQGEKRALIPKEELISRDPLLVITGTKSTRDAKEPPKEVSLTAGEWAMKWIGNREILSEFGDVLKLAQIPRGKVSGAWAACIGLSLQQQWREEATKAQKNLVSRGKTEGPKTEVLKFRPFTRRELLLDMFKCDNENSPKTILDDPKGRRARAEEYWQAAIKGLNELGVIGHYRETIKVEEMNTSDLNKAWLDQPLDIRPSDVILKDALEIHNSAIEAKKRGRRSGQKATKKVA